MLHSRTRPLALTALAIIALVACGCGVGKVTVDVAQHPDVGTRGYRSYRWKHPAVSTTQGRRDMVTRTDWAVRTAVQERLAAKGYAGPEAGEADLVVDYDIDVRTKHTNTFRDLAAYKAAGGTKNMGDSWVQGFEEGVLVLQVTDPARGGEVVWQGAASAVVDPKRSGKNIPRAVDRLLSRFPDVF